MEVWLVSYHRCGIFRHLTAHPLCGRAVLIADRIKSAGSQTSSAALAELLIDKRLSALKGDGIRTALPCALPAASAKIRIHYGLSVIVLLHLAGTACASHAEILDGSAESAHLMSLKMIQRDDDIGIIQGPSYVGLLAVFAVFYRDRYLICPLESVSYEHITARSHAVKSVHFGIIKMIHRILSASGIEGIAVSKKRLAPQLLYEIRYCLHIIRPEVCKVAKLAEVHLNGSKTSVEVDIRDACPAT